MTFLSDVFSPATAQRLGWTLLHSVWQFALIAVLLSAFLAALRRRSANTRYLTACIGLVAMLTTSMATYRWFVACPTAELAVTAATDGAMPRGRIDARDEATPNDFAEAPPFTSTELVDDDPSAVVAAAPPALGNYGTSSDAANASLATLPRRITAGLAPWLPWVSLAWLGGVILISARHFGGWVGVQRLRWVGTTKVAPDLSERARRLMDRMKISRPVGILQSTLAELPIVVGWLRPVVLLPASLLTGLTSKQLEAILAHELAHVRRYDYLVNLLQTAVETLLFYHPAIWWLSRRIRTEREHCCDDVAVAVCGNNVDYAEALAAVEQRRAAALAMAIGGHGRMGSALGRVRRVLGVSAEDRPRWTSAIGGSVAVLLLILTIVGYVAIAAEPKEKPAQATVLSARNVKQQDAAELAWGEANDGVKIKATVGRRAWRIGEGAPQAGHPNVPQLRVEVRVSDAKQFNDAGLDQKRMSHAPSAFALDIDGRRYDNHTLYTARPVPLMQPFKTALAMDDRGWVRSGQRQHLVWKPGKHTVRVLFTGLGQDPAPVSQPVEIEILPADSKLTAWEHDWGEAVQGVEVSAHPTKGEWPLGSEPTLRVRIRNTGEERWTFHSRPYSFGLLIDGQRYRDQHAYHTWGLPFGPGDEYELTLQLNKLWSEGELGAAWSPFLRPLAPGKHTVRVVLTELGRFVQPQSLPVEIEVTGPVAAAPEDQANMGKKDDGDKLVGQWLSDETEPVKHTFADDGGHTLEQPGDEPRRGTWRSDGRNLVFKLGEEEHTHAFQWWGPDKIRVFSEDTRSRWHLLRIDPQSGNVIRWGEMIAGVMARLKPMRPSWSVNETPMCDVLIHQASFGELQLATAQMDGSRLEVDGRIYQHPAEEISGAAYHRSLVWMEHLNGRGPRIVLDSRWRSVEGDRPLKLAPGKYTLRYGWPGYHASNSDPSQIDKERPVLLWSGPVEIEIVASVRSSVKATKEKEANRGDTLRKVAFYLLDEDVPSDAMRGDLSKLKLAQKPLLTLQDIIAFDPQGSQLFLKEPARKRLFEGTGWEKSERDREYTEAELAERRAIGRRSIRPSRSIEPFVLVVDGRRILGGHIAGPIASPITPAILHSPPDKGVQLSLPERQEKTFIAALRREGKLGGWGPAVDGVQIRLHAAKNTCKAGEKPALLTDFRNHGKRDLELVLAPEWWELECDGTWYGTTVFRSGDVPVFPFAPGRQTSGVSVPLEDTWGWRSKDNSEPLVFGPGKHAIRVAFRVHPSRPRINPPVRVVSKPIEIVVVQLAAEPVDSAQPSFAPHKLFAAGHGEDVNVLAVAFSPNGKLMAALDQTAKVILRDAGTGEQIVAFDMLTSEEKELVFYKYPIRRILYGALAFSPDGKTLAVGSDPVVRMYETETARAQLVLKDKQLAAEYGKIWGHKSEELKRIEAVPHAHGRVHSIAFSPDGTTLATSGEHIFEATGAIPGRLKLWETKTGKMTQDLGLHFGEVRSVAFTPDGKVLASAGVHPPRWTSSVRFWDPQGGAVKKVLQSPRGDPWSVAFSPDGKLLAAGGIVSEGDDKTSGMLLIWDARTGALLFDRALTTAVTSVAFSADGETLASGEYDRGVTLWDPTTLNPTCKLNPIDPPSDMEGPVHVAFSPKGNLLAAAAENTKLGGFVTVWALNSTER